MFEVGKKVIAIADHAGGRFKRGDVFLLIGIKTPNCKCAPLSLNIGLAAKYTRWRCSDCGVTGNIKDSFLWQNSVDFVPYDDSLSTLTADQLLEQLELVTA